MGLTSQSSGLRLLEDSLLLEGNEPSKKVIALGGNPNVGKSTVFNRLTGLNQHTGNWPGKTVTNALGKYKHKGTDFILVDLPGTYSLMSNSQEEEIARDFICFASPDATVIVTDATCFERNINLVLQTLEITNKVVVCVNLLDEAKKKNIKIDLDELSHLLKLPVIGTSARSGKGLDSLMDLVEQISCNGNENTVFQVKYETAMEEAIQILEPTISQLVPPSLNSRWVTLKLLDGDTKMMNSLTKYLNFDLLSMESVKEKIEEAHMILSEHGIEEDMFRDKMVSQIVHTAENITNKVISYGNLKYNDMDRKIDRILTSKLFGIPIMIALLGMIFWLSIVGANIPSSMLADLFFWFEGQLTNFFTWMNAPSWLHGALVLGVYKTLAWVVSVMLPPMAIFFPLFTLLEDLGYLPRVAFNLDKYFKCACAHGKQALTMCMGFGCNAAGIIGCRIIESPREKLVAMITNSFVPCNGRFPTLLAIISMFFVGFIAGPYQSVIASVILTSVIVLGVFMTFFVSKILSRTILKGMPSSFTLELPPYRKPQFGRVLLRSIFDRTLFVLSRAILVAAPAGLIIWCLANIKIQDLSLLAHCATFLHPFARLIGLDGYILLAFILGFPANEIVFPIIIMSYLTTGNIVELGSLDELHQLLVANGWTWLTALCTVLFSLMHWPCGTTCLTIRKEAGSLKWMFASILIPTTIGMTICFLVASIARLLGLA